MEPNNMTIYKPFYYLFYRQLKFSEIYAKETITGNPPLIAGITMLQTMNILSLFSLFKYFNITEFYLEKNYFISIIVTLFIINSVLFLKKGDEAKIIAMFENETEKQKKVGRILVWAYIIISAFLFILPLILKL